MMGHEELLYALMSFALPFSFIIVFGLCLCGCRKQSQKNDLLGLAGMVKITNPDENVIDVTVLGPIPEKDSIIEDDTKRLKITANPHRSLPDIPIYSDGGTGETLTEGSEVVTGDMISELYATVGDQARRDLQNSPRPRITTKSNSNRSSVHQHCVDNHADDITSPYATVRNPDHTYNRVHMPEHPYARLQTSRTEAASDNLNNSLSNSRRNSVEPLQSYSDIIDGSPSTVDIPAAPAIAGRVSANQELPYMTPPIQSNTHFSGDSQDSSKGYTSISVREPLVNILAQVDPNIIRRPNRTELVDSHYATVSDDSDEMYAAIDEPFAQADVYTSVSETYAQIQPPVENQPEINQNNSLLIQNNNNVSGFTEGPQCTPMPTNKDIEVTNPAAGGLQHLTQVHSRQDSSSSCVSSVGNLGSPKPEKRQANSPLPPPPSSPINFMLCKPLTNTDVNKANESAHSMVRNSTSDLYNITRPSLETCKINNNNVLQNEQDVKKISLNELDLLNEGTLKDNTKLTSSAKDLEEMYAKVVKKNKHLSSFMDDKVLQKKNDEHNNLIKSGISVEDIPNELYESDSDITSDVSLDLFKNKKSKDIDIAQKTIDKDPGYETIHDKREAGYKDPGYETIDKNAIRDRNNTDCSSLTVADKNFGTTLGYYKHVNQSSSDASLEHLINDCNYEGIHNTTNASSDSDPNYEVLRPLEDFNGSNPELNAQHSSKNQNNSDKMYGYSTISELINSKKESTKDIAGYSTVKKNKSGNTDLHCSDHNYESLSQYRTVNCECDPNYESVEQLSVETDPPYTRLQDESPVGKTHEISTIPAMHCDSAITNNRAASSKRSTDEVDDYFQV